MDMQSSGSGATDTGADDKTYNLVSVLYHALHGAENSEICAEDADDDQRQFFDRVCDQYRQIAQEAKHLLHDQLMHGEGIGQNGQSQASSDDQAMSGSDALASGQASASAGAM